MPLPRHASTMTVDDAQNAAQAVYRGSAGRRYHVDKRGVPPEAVAWIARARAALFNAHVRPGDEVLEFGVGAGWNLLGLQARRRVGCDVSDLARDAMASAGIEFVGGMDELASGSFDRVLCHHALEHVPDPVATLVAIRRVMRPGGLLLLAVPWESQRRYRRFVVDEPNHHLFSWNVQSLGNLVGVAGFRIRRIGLRRYGYDRAAAAWAVRLKLGEGGFRLLRAMARGLVPIREIFAELVVGGIAGTEHEHGTSATSH